MKRCLLPCGKEVFTRWKKTVISFSTFSNQQCFTEPKRGRFTLRKQNKKTNKQTKNNYKWWYWLFSSKPFTVEGRLSLDVAFPWRLRFVTFQTYKNRAPSPDSVILRAVSAQRGHVQPPLRAPSPESVILRAVSAQRGHVQRPLLDKIHGEVWQTLDYTVTNDGAFRRPDTVSLKPEKCFPFSALTRSYPISKLLTVSSQIQQLDDTVGTHLNSKRRTTLPNLITVHGCVSQSR